MLDKLLPYVYNGGIMDLSAILNLFNQTVPIGVVFLVIYLIRMSRDIKHNNERLSQEISNVNERLSQEIKHSNETLGQHIRSINEKLDNHITDTNKKIEDTRRELVNLRKDTNEQFSRLYELLIQDRKQKQAKQ